MATNQNEYNQALQNLIKMSGKKIEIKKVYQNASPASGFSEQLVTIDFGDVKEGDLIAIEALMSTGDTYKRKSTFIARYEIDSSVTLNFVYTNSAKVAGFYRLVTIKNNGLYLYAGWASTVSSDTQNKASCIPVAVYIIKGVI